MMQQFLRFSTNAANKSSFSLPVYLRFLFGDLGLKQNKNVGLPTLHGQGRHSNSRRESSLENSLQLEKNNSGRIQADQFLKTRNPLD